MKLKGVADLESRTIDLRGSEPARPVHNWPKVHEDLTVTLTSYPDTPTVIIANDTGPMHADRDLTD